MPGPRPECPSPASPATSRRRSSARCARARATPRTPTAPAASCSRTWGPKPVASRHDLLTTVAWKREGRLEYALEGSVFIGGAVVQWLRDGLGHHPYLGRGRAPRRVGRGQRRGLPGAGLRRARRAPLGSLCARHPRGDHPGHRAPATSRAPRSKRSPIRSPTCSTPCAPTPGGRSGSCAWTAAPRATTCCCSSRPTSSACPWCGPRSPRPPPSAPPTWRDWPWASGRTSRAIASQWQVAARFEPKMQPAQRRRPSAARWRERPRARQGLGAGGLASGAHALATSSSREASMNRDEMLNASSAGRSPGT